MCSQFQRLEIRDRTHVTNYSYRKWFEKYESAFLCSQVALFLFVISNSMIIASFHANLRTSTLLNVTRITSRSANDTHVREDLSNCTTASLEHCEQFDNGSWYIQSYNSVYGKQVKYFYFVENGYTVSCKPIVDRRLREDIKYKHMPCSYYVGLSFLLGCLVSTSICLLVTKSNNMKMSYWILLWMGYSWVTLVLCLMLLAVSVVEGVNNFTGFITNFLFDIAIGRTFPAMTHFYMVATVGWMSIFSQRHFMVKKSSKPADTRCRHFYNLFVEWAPFCSYFPVFFFVNWLLSYEVPLFPASLMPTCDESCWRTQKSLLHAFAAPVTTFILFNLHGHVMYKYYGSQLQETHLKENFLLLSKLLYAMGFIWLFGVWAHYAVAFDWLRVAFNIFTLSEGFLLLIFAILYDRFKKRD